MSVERNAGSIAFSCDSCPESFEPEEDRDFGAAWAEAKSTGWKAYQFKGVWQHRCPGCDEDEV